MSVWSFLSTLVRSLLALFSPRRRAADLDRAQNDALDRAHSRLRPIVLTPRSIAHQRAQSTSSSHATVSAPQSSGPQRTSPELGALDPELGLPAATCNLPGPGAVSFREGTPDTSHTGSSCVAPLTPPDRSYLGPLPSTTDCPYTEPWPTSAPLDRSKPRLPGSPLRVSTNTNPAFSEPMVAPIGSPPPGRWSPLQVWTSTPCKNDSPPVPEQDVYSLDPHKDPSSVLANISHALISRSQSSVTPYDGPSHSSVPSDASSSANYANGPAPIRKPHRTQARAIRSKDHPHPQFHHPDAYAYAWRRHCARLPGKTGRNRTHARSRSDMDLPLREWYGADAYAPSPLAALSPPLGETTTGDEDEEEMPLDRLRERLTRRSIGLGIPAGAGVRKATGIFAHTRRMSEGCLLAISESTPTRVGVHTRSGRHAHSFALEDDGYEVKDWLEALSLRFSSEKMGPLVPMANPRKVGPSFKAVAG